MTIRLSVVGQWLNKLFSKFEQLDIRYCVLHSYEDLPDTTVSDVDIAIDRRGMNMLESILDKLSQDSELKIIQKLHYDVRFCYFYVLSYIEKNKLPSLVKIDFLSDYRGTNHYYITTSIFLSGRCPYKNFYIPSPSVEIMYLILKRIIKGEITEKHEQRIKELYGKDKSGFRNLLVKYFGDSTARSIEKIIARDRWDEFRSKIPEFKHILRTREMISHPLNSTIRWCQQIVRVIQRIRHPTGLVVVLLGPDGTGKSSVGKEVLKQLLGGFRRVKYFHWRPGVLPQIGQAFGREQGSYSEPHKEQPHSIFVSLLRFFYYTADFILGYYLRILPAKIRSTLVIIDRYYYDFLVDPLRYRFKLPECIPHILMVFVPKPDLVIYLDGSPEILHNRKQELGLKELARQVTAFQKLLPSLPNACKVNVERPFNEVAHEATSIIIKKMANRFQARHKTEDTRLESSEWYHILTSLDGIYEIGDKRAYYKGIFDKVKTYGIVPTKDNPRWIIPLGNRKLTTRSMEIYNPISKKARIGKWGVKILCRIGLNHLWIQDKITVAYNKKDNTLQELLSEILHKSGIEIALSTGTPGCYRKTTAQVMSENGEILAYVKIANTEQAKGLLSQEAKILKRLKELNLVSASIPEVLYYGEHNRKTILVQSTIKGQLYPGPRKLTSQHINFLSEIFAKTCTFQIFRTSGCLSNLQNRTQELMGRISKPWVYRFQQAFSLITTSIGGKNIPLGICHKDFAPWNTHINQGKLFVFDWEYAQEESIPFRDIFHFVIQTGVLVNRMKSPYLLNILSGSDKNLLNLISKYATSVEVEISLIPNFLLFYLCDISVFYLNMSTNYSTVSNKDKLLLSTWAEMLDTLLANFKDAKSWSTRR